MPFEHFAGVKLAVEASGTVENMIILEEIDMNKAANKLLNLWPDISLLDKFE